MIDVFSAGIDGFGNYRIPALLKLLDGTLLAFCEAREFLSDHAQNKIVLKRSADDGKSWGKLQLIADGGKDALNNPLVVQDEDSRDVILMYQKYPFTPLDAIEDKERWKSHVSQNFPANIHEGAVLEGYIGRVCRTFVQRSSDGGITWSNPLEITKQVKRPTKITSYAGGPGIGIQLKYGNHKGRIVMPFSQGPWGEMKVFAVYSDIGDKSWQYGNVASSADGIQANEVQMAELADGSIILNARSYKGNKRRRIAFSKDGGINWSILLDAKDLKEPECQGSMISFHRKNNTDFLIYCGPSDSEHRSSGMLKQSMDKGASWQDLKSVYSRFFAYSSIFQLDSQDIGVLFERDEYAKISFKKIKVSDA